MSSSPVIPMLPEDHAHPADLVAAIRARRGGSLLKLDRMLLHSPPLAEGWNIFLGKVRTDLSVPIKLRELVMCVVAVLNGASFEYEHHAPIFVSAGGTVRQAEMLAHVGTPQFSMQDFSSLEQNVIRLAQSMTRDLIVDAEIKANLVAALGIQQTVELVGVVATYNMVSRFLLALDIHADDPVLRDEVFQLR
ncbi:MAG: carboxymuconolactone decarboxylase family protein [Burkholderiaceae bacterium]